MNKIKRAILCAAMAARRRVAADADAGRWLRAFRQRLDAQLAQPPQIFARGGQWVMWLNCRKCATRLTSESPTRHVCPACGEAHSGWPYDRTEGAGTASVRQQGMGVDRT